MFSKVKPAGWAFGERLTSGQMNDIDTKTAAAVDGVGGGTYTPSSAITINGAGLACNTFSATGNCTIGSDSADSHQMNGTFAFNDTVGISNLAVDDIDVSDLDVNTLFTCDGSATINGSAVFNSTAFFNDDVTFNDPVAFTDTVQIISALSVTGMSTFSAPVTFATGGRIRHKVTYGTDADITLNAGDCTMFIMKDGVMTTSRTVTLGTTGAADGDTIEISCRDNATDLNVTNGTGNVNLRAATGSPNFVRAVFDGSLNRFEFHDVAANP